MEHTAPEQLAEIVDSSVDVRRFDVLGEIHFDEARTDGVLARIDSTTGFLIVDAANTARTGVQIYGDGEGNTWGELRPDEEVFDDDSVQSMNMNVVTNDHPTAFVTKDNVREVQVGHTGADARRDGRFLVQSFTVTDQDTIRAIQAGKRQLSRGYFARLVKDVGVTEGQPHAVRQTNIRGNHLAIVDRGRAGPECGIGLVRGDAFTLHTEDPPMPTNINDGARLGALLRRLMREKEVTTAQLASAAGISPSTVSGILAGDIDVPPIQRIRGFARALGVSVSQLEATLPKRENDNMNTDTKTVTIDGKDYEVPAAVAAQLADAGPMPPDDDDEEEEDTMPKTADDTTALRAEIDALKADADSRSKSEAARIDARVNLVTTAREVLGPDARTTGVSDDALRRAVILHVQPALKGRLDGESADYVRASFDACVDLHRNRAQVEADMNRVVFDAMSSGADEPTLDDEYASYLNRYKRTPATAGGEN